MGEQIRARGLALVVSSCLVVQAGSASARSEPESPQSTEQYQVLLRVDASRTSREEVELALRGQLVDLPVNLRVIAQDDAPEAFERRVGALARDEGADLVVWLGYEPDDRLFVYMSEAGRGRTLVRELGGEGTPSPHAVALVVRSVVEALVLGGRIGVEPSPAEAKAKAEPPPEESKEKTTAVPVVPAPPPTELDPTPAPSEPARRRPRLAGLLGVAYQPTAFAAEHPVVHAVPISAQMLVGPHAAVFVRYRVVIPFRIENELVELRVQSFPAELGARGQARLGRWDVGGRLGLLFDAMRREAVPLDGTVEPGPAQTQLLIALSPAAAFGLWAHPRVRIGLELGVDAYFRRIDFLVAGPEGDTPIASTLGWRPWAALGIAFGVGPQAAFQPVSQGERH